MITKNWFVIIRTNEDGTLTFFWSDGEDWGEFHPGCLYPHAEMAYEHAAVFGGKVNMITLTLRPITE